jgi:Tfp pilus assembly protein PilF
VIIDYFVTQRGRFISNISDNEFVAMYYLNMAGEALEKQDYAKAYWHTIEALNYSPVDATAWNMMAVVYRRAGKPAKAGDYMSVVDRATHEAKAEEIYLFAIEHAEDKLTLLKNYHLLLTSQMRTAEAAAIEQRLNSMEDPSPFHWFLLARNSYDMKDFAAAIRYFDKALEIAPYLHEAHLGKAQSFYQMGALTETKRALKMAIMNVDRSSTRSLYEAKLMALADN